MQMQAATEEDSEEEELPAFGGSTRWNPVRPSRACIDEVKKFQRRHLYTGRGGPHRERSFRANPFKVRAGGKKHAITQYEDYVRNKEGMLERILQLQGKVLVCHCWMNEAYHADVLIRLFDEHFANVSDYEEEPPRSSQEP